MLIFHSIFSHRLFSEILVYCCKMRFCFGVFFSCKKLFVWQIQIRRFSHLQAPSLSSSHSSTMSFSKVLSDLPTLPQFALGSETKPKCFKAGSQFSKLPSLKELWLVNTSLPIPLAWLISHHLDTHPPPVSLLPGTIHGHSKTSTFHCF